MMASFLDALVLTVVGMAVVFLVLAIDALVTSLLKSASREKKEATTPLPSQRTLLSRSQRKVYQRQREMERLSKKLNQKWWRLLQPLCIITC